MRKVAIAPELAVPKVTVALRGFLYYLSRMYFIRFLFALLYFGIRVVLVRWRGGKQAVGLLRALEQQFDGQFDAATFRKVVKSHSVYLSIVNDAFTGLHGRNTNRKEQERSILYFICSSLFDNFFDDQSRSHDAIMAMTFAPDTYTPTDFNDRVGIYAHQQLLAYVKDKHAYLAVLKKEYAAQAASQEQFDAQISNERIQAITFEKGGNAVLLCKFYLDVEAGNAESAAWYRLGTLIQLSNDLFDIYKDTQAGIHTLATRCTDAYAMETHYLNLVSDMHQCIQQIPTTAWRKQRFSIAMAGTYALGLVAIQQLKKLQGASAQLPQFANLPRKALIVDMEQFGNMWRWLRFVYQFGKL